MLNMSNIIHAVQRSRLCLMLIALMGLSASKSIAQHSQAATPTTTVFGPVNVGLDGNEPLIAAASDGTLYISALQHLYRSADQGATWMELAGPIYASSLNLNSDSSISVDPNNRLYFTFDYPYAGTTAVCTSDDRGDSWNCNPAVVPGGTDRMWVLAPTPDSAFEVTNQGLYETAFLQSVDGGSTWLPKSLGAGLLEPQTGPLLQLGGSSDVLQIVKIYGTLPQETPELKLYVYHPGTTGSVISDVRSTGLPLPIALPSAAIGKDGQLWAASEELNSVGGKQVVLAHSTNAGATWAKLAPVPGTTQGTAIFSWVAAGSAGHVGVLYYYTGDNGDPGALTNSTWSAVWAESFNANSSVPTWTVTTIESDIHRGPICVAASCSGTDRFAGDFITALIDNKDVAHLTWVRQAIDPVSGQATGTPTIRYARVSQQTTVTKPRKPHR